MSDLVGGLPEPPDAHALEYWNRTLRNHRQVAAVEEINDNTKIVTCAYGDAIRCYITNIYRFGLADYLAIKAHDSLVTCIINISDWNAYSGDARETAIEAQVGLFSLREFLGALHLRRRIWTYVKNED
jgi:hypothetical protein